MDRHTIGQYFEDFTEGDVIQHALSKTIFESDNNLFSLITMNHHPVHLNEDYSKKETHGKILVVGTLVFSLAVGLTVPDISGKAIANLEYSRVVHRAPVFIGDTIYAQSEVIGLWPSQSRTDRGVVGVRTIVENQNEDVVLEFERRALIKRRPKN